MNKIFLLEDEKNLGLTLSEKLTEVGYKVTWAQTLSECQKIIQSTPEITLALLDVMLPDGSGLDAARSLRSSHPQTPILFLSAAGTPDDRVKGLELGAADYVVKPFHWQELLLRIQNTISQQQMIAGTSSAPTKVGLATLDLSAFELENERDGKVQLSEKECRLLQLLLKEPGRVVSRDEILDTVWTQNEYPSSRTVDNFILRLRKWLEPLPEKPQHILTVRGVGYRLKV